MLEFSRRGAENPPEHGLGFRRSHSAAAGEFQTIGEPRVHGEFATGDLEERFNFRLILARADDLRELPQKVGVLQTLLLRLQNAEEIGGLVRHRR